MTIDLLTRAAGKLGTFNSENRTVEVVFATEQPVRRRTWDGEFDEILVCTKAAVDSGRMASMSVLDTHRGSGLDARVGSVLANSLRFEPGAAIATVKISRSEKGDAIIRDLEDGMSIPISVGYKILKEERVEGAGGAVAQVRAVRWQPMEISFVPIPADAGAHTRSEEDMTDTLTITRAEKKRQTDIRALAKSAGIDTEDELVVRAIEDDMTLDGFRSAMLDKLIATEEKTPTFPHRETFGANDRYQEQLAARQAAIVARMTGKAPEGNARDFMGASLLDHARGLLDAQGVDTRGMNREQVLGYRGRSIGGMHTTSDFPLLLQGAGERVLMDAYALAQSPLKTVLSRRSTATDFRAKSKLKTSDAGLLEKVTETGEITSTTRAETAESYKIDSYGRIFALSFQSIVNDDLGAFSDWATQAGRMAALTENKVLLDLLLANSGAGPKMGEDNKNLFHADHDNLASAGTALDESSLANAILSFRRQTALGGAARLAIPPRYLLVGPELEIPAQKLVATISAAKTDDAVPDAIKSLVPIVESNLDGKSWRLFADPAQQAIFEWSYLAGHEGPQIDTREGFERLGTEFRAVLHFGAGAIDFRGAYLNPGV